MFLTKYTQPNYQVSRVSYTPLFRDFGDLFDEIFYKTTPYNSRLKLNETDSQYTLTLELPGFEQSEVEVVIEDKILLIKAKNKERETSRELSLWEGIDFNKVGATMKNGLLTVDLPKLEKVKPRKINVT